MGIKGRRKKIAPATILLLALGAALWFFYGNRQPEADFSNEAAGLESGRAGHWQRDAAQAQTGQAAPGQATQGEAPRRDDGGFASRPAQAVPIAPTPSSGAASSINKALVYGQVQDVPDGDSLVLLFPNGRRERVRLYGIDAPEGAQEGGKAARSFSAGLCMNARVRVEEQYRDQYNRIVGIVTLPGGRVLNAELLRAGHAWVYYQYCESPWKEAWLPLQKEAKARKAGLWGGENPLEPWQWRRQHPRE